MKKIAGLVFVSVLGGAIALGSYTLFFENKAKESPQITTTQQADSKPHQLVANKYNTVSSTNADFSEAAEKTVHAVVHVKNVSISQAPRSISEYIRGMRGGKTIQGAGSGVIITEDGYIVTNNHVIQDASEIEITLNNNRTYTAEVVGTDPQSDIALLKIDATGLEYIPFGDSDHVQLGEWALAVGNPFNLTSTVTAGIISAKGRDLNEGDARMQSFIQTDAAINPGNSGGALVNIRGELIGINTAITSQTGSYIGYGFAVPSNNARKIVEDILEYGDVQQAILGITGGTINPSAVKENELSISQGVYIHSSNKGAKKAGLKEGDLITKIDGIAVRKLSDLTAYIRTKRPNDNVSINYLRNGKEKTAQVTLEKYETYALQIAGVEITNANEEYLAAFDAEYGVRISQTLSQELQIPKDKFIITKIDGTPVTNVGDVREIMKKKHPRENTTVTFRGKNAYEESYVFRP